VQLAQLKASRLAAVKVAERGPCCWFTASLGTVLSSVRSHVAPAHVPADLARVTGLVPFDTSSRYHAAVNAEPQSNAGAAVGVALGVGVIVAEAVGVAVGATGVPESVGVGVGAAGVPESVGVGVGAAGVPESVGVGVGVAACGVAVAGGGVAVWVGVGVGLLGGAALQAGKAQLPHWPAFRPVSV
jgi:hypothetical protein